MFPVLFHGSCLYLTAREKQRGPSRAKPKKDCIDYEQYCEATPESCQQLVNIEIERRDRLSYYRTRISEFGVRFPDEF